MMKKLCNTGDVPNGGCRRIELTDRPPIAVFNLHGRFYVTDDTCTHGEASLCDGEVDSDDGVVECPYHQGAFEIATGRPAGAPCSIPLRVYRVEVTDETIYAAIDVKEPACP